MDCEYLAQKRIRPFEEEESDDEEGATTIVLSSKLLPSTLPCKSADGNPIVILEPFDQMDNVARSLKVKLMLSSFWKRSRRWQRKDALK